MKPAYLFLIPFLLAACGGEEFQDLHVFVKNAGSDMRGKVDPPPQIKQYEPFNYDNSSNLPNPFMERKPVLKNGAFSGLNQPDLNRHREALEEFPLDGLKMVGFLLQGKDGYAIIRSPDSKLHRVKVGNYMGQNFGKISSITETDVQLKEMIQDSSGDWSERVSSLQLVE